MSFKRPRVIKRIKNTKAIKESFDTLPMAVCFFDGDGIARLVNRRMLEVSEQLLGSGAQTLCELMAALEKPPEGIEPLEGGKSVYRFPDGRVLRFCESKVTDPYGNAYTEVTASDVTELIELENELKAENASLEEANRRIRELSRAMPELIREEETLAMLATRYLLCVRRCAAASTWRQYGKAPPSGNAQLTFCAERAARTIAATR